MEGDACYKYRTLAGYLHTTSGKPVELILDIGANQGSVTCELAHVFPKAIIHAYEPIKQWFEIACKNTARWKTRVTVYCAAVTAQHRYLDDLGMHPVTTPPELVMYYATENVGGSFLAAATRSSIPPAVKKTDYRPELVTLDEAVEHACSSTGRQEVDFIKTDCEGAEISFLGCAARDTLERIRYIGGEYHNISRFWPVVQKLFLTHRVNLTGDRLLGSFFAERLDQAPGLLGKTVSKLRRAFWPDTETHWHAFRREFVPRNKFLTHGICNG